MNIGDAIRKRINDLCFEYSITLNKLCTMSGITQSTLDNFMRGNSKTPTVQTISYICDGLGIKIYDFFNSPIFDEIDE